MPAAPSSLFKHLPENTPLAKPLLSLSNVNLTLRSRAGSVHILKDVGLAVTAGETIGIVGPSGSGKTSLLMVIAGLEPVTSGEIYIDGEALHGKSEDALATLRRNNIGIVFQSFHLIPTLSALDNVALPLEFRGIPGAVALARETLGSVGLAHRLEHYPGQMSGGEQQRVAIARALASGAKMILADEPTGNLDQETGKTIMDMLFDVRKTRGTSLLLVTHDRNLAERCDRVIEVRDGKLAEKTR